MQHVKTLIALATVFLTGCLATPATTLQSIMPTELVATPAPKAKAAAESFNLEKAELDLMRPDGSACKAVSDGGFASNMLLMGQVGMSLAMNKFTEGGVENMPGLQTTLDSIRPQLKQLAKQVVWLPMEAEVAIGQQMFKMGDFRVWKPVNKAQRAFVEGPLKRSFNELKSYAEGDLQSPLKFEMQLIRDDNSRSPEMMPGGMLIIPSGMVSHLTGQEDAQQTLAFILAHEFAHALRRHTTKSIQGRLVDGLAIAEVFNKQFKGTRDQLTRLDPSNLSQLFNLSTQGVTQIIGAVCLTEKWFTDFDQNQELEADTCGALLLDKLGSALSQNFDPVRGLNRYRAMSILSKKPVAQATKGACLQAASHPAVEAREQNLIRYRETLIVSRGQAKVKGPNANGLQPQRGPRD